MSDQPDRDNLSSIGTSELIGLLVEYAKFPTSIGNSLLMLAQARILSMLTEIMTPPEIDDRPWFADINMKSSAACAPVTIDLEAKNEESAEKEAQEFCAQSSTFDTEYELVRVYQDILAP
jgi:hypothetical protein